MATVQTSDGFTVTSNHETAASMKQALTSAKTTAQEIAPSTPSTPTPSKPSPPPPPAPDGREDATPIEEPTDPTAPPPTPGEQRRKASRETIQQRIDRAVAAQRDAERERDHWKTQATTRRPDPPPQPQRPPAPRQHPGFDPRDPEPTLEQFATAPDPVVAYVRDLGLWSGRQEVRAANRAAQQRANQQSADAFEQQRATTLTQKLSAAVTDGDPERLPEFLDTLSDAVIGLRTFAQLNPGERPTGATAVADYIVDAAGRDDGAPHLLMQYFSQNPDDLQRLSTLPPSVVMGQMGRIEERLIAAHPSGPAQTPVSRARTPIKPVAGSQRTVTDTAPKDSDDLATFIKKGNALDPRLNPKLAMR